MESKAVFFFVAHVLCWVDIEDERWLPFQQILLDSGVFVNVLVEILLI